MGLFFFGLYDFYVHIYGKGRSNAGFACMCLRPRYSVVSYFILVERIDIEGSPFVTRVCLTSTTFPRTQTTVMYRFIHVGCGRGHLLTVNVDSGRFAGKLREEGCTERVSSIL